MNNRVIQHDLFYNICKPAHTFHGDYILILGKPKLIAIVTSFSIPSLGIFLSVWTQKLENSSERDQQESHPVPP